ncbi:MAG TPA: hypothetical protein VG737_16805 [Cyclobacteriaceae bacterium]|nr:hypothetical protein [Cyclobacteriaceae bacterium]
MQIQKGYFIKLSEELKARIKTLHNYAQVERNDGQIVDAYFVNDEDVIQSRVLVDTGIYGRTVCFHHYDNFF